MESKQTIIERTPTFTQKNFFQGYPTGQSASFYRRGDYVKHFLTGQDLPHVGVVVRVLPEINRLDVFWEWRGVERVSPEDVHRVSVDTMFPREFRVPKWQLDIMERQNGMEDSEDFRIAPAQRTDYKVSQPEFYIMEDPGTLMVKQVNNEDVYEKKEASREVSFVGSPLVVFASYIR